MDGLAGNPRDRFESDIENIDQIVLQAADILYALEKHLSSGALDIDAFSEEVSRTFELDATRKLLLERALTRYRGAIEYTRGEPVATGFLASTKLDLSAYEGIHAGFDSRRPGVIVIHLKSKKDAAQFNSDIETDFAKRLRQWGREIGATVNIIGEGRAFVGKSVDLESLGISEALPILGVIVVCDEVEDPLEKEGITNHEYAHALYRSLLQPFIHRYLSGAQFKTLAEFMAWTTKFTTETRGRLFAALGDFSTHRSDQLKDRIENPPKPSPLQASRRARGRIAMATPEALETQLESLHYDNLHEEQYLLNEMRGYGFSHPALDPHVRITSLEIKIPEHENELGVMDAKMVERYFRLHRLVLRAYYKNSDTHLKVLSVLGTSQTLSQAIRLVEPLLQTGEWMVPSKADFDDLTTTLAALSKPESLPLYAIERNVGGEAIIPNQDAVRDLLLPKSIFDAASARYYPEEKPIDVIETAKLYMEG